MVAPELVVVHEPTTALRQAVDALAARIGAAMDHAPLSEHQRMVLARESWGPDGPSDDGRRATGVVARDSADGADPVGVVGYAQVARDHTHEAYAVELLVDAGRDGSPAVADALLGSALEEVARWGGGPVRLWVPKASAADDALSAAHGFVPERDLIQMRCPLPPPRSAALGASQASGRSGDDFPLPTRPFRPGRDEDAWLAVNNRAFESHPEQGHWDRATLEEREREPWFDPDGFLVLESGGRMAGSCWTKVHAATYPPMGEIYVIGVDPDFHGRGWGRALTWAGLDWLAGRGLSVGMLYVDADNGAAVHLYRSMGFTEDHVDRSYLRTVDAG
jgi:mycothiol synthase